MIHVSTTNLVRGIKMAKSQFKVYCFLSYFSHVRTLSFLIIHVGSGLEFNGEVVEFL